MGHLMSSGWSTIPTENQSAGLSVARWPGAVDVFRIQGNGSTIRLDTLIPRGLDQQAKKRFNRFLGFAQVMTRHGEKDLDFVCICKLRLGSKEGSFGLVEHASKLIAISHGIISDIRSRRYGSP